jgi:hypothetical protein
MAGSSVNKMKKSRSPWRDFGRLRASSPSHKWLGYFQVKRRDAENGNRDGRAPQQSPSRAAKGGLGWTNDV